MRFQLQIASVLDVVKLGCQVDSQFRYNPCSFVGSRARNPGLTIPIAQTELAVHLQSHQTAPSVSVVQHISNIVLAYLLPFRWCRTTADQLSSTGTDEETY
jgi:hypothetical protein